MTRAHNAIATPTKKTSFQRKQEKAEALIAKLKASEEETVALLARLEKEYQVAHPR